MGRHIARTGPLFIIPFTITDLIIMMCPYLYYHEKPCSQGQGQSGVMDFQENFSQRSQSTQRKTILFVSVIFANSVREEKRQIRM